MIRPCKGHEPYLAECLSSTFQQDYPPARLTLYLCVSSRDDPATPIIESVLTKFSEHDARLYVEDEDPALLGTRGAEALGPNPKIRNMSRAYREGKGDLVWVIDCNVWVSRGACARMVDKLCGYGPNDSLTTAYKLVHHLPICVDVHDDYKQNNASRKLLRSMSQSHDAHARPTTYQQQQNGGGFGGRQEELFLASSHAKMYTAISSVAVAPCIVGKSNMFRRSHLYALSRGMGIDYFSHNICEDHLIGDLLWKSTIGHQQNDHQEAWDEPGTWRRIGNHGLVKGDLAIQPVAGMSVSSYIARRVRWLRVRKFTVPAATAVEPGTESIFCSLMGAWGITTSPTTRDFAGSTWSWFLAWWIGSMVIWNCVDWTVYLLLHSGATIETSHGREDIPAFALPTRGAWKGRRRWHEWLRAWLGREFLAFGVWFWAIWGGVAVTWRERKFWVGLDMRVHEVPDDRPKEENGYVETNGYNKGHVQNGKIRTD